MTNPADFDFEFTIFGAGIAGLSMADALLNRGKSVAIIDTGQPGGGSSGAPLILINPATGRRAKLVKDAEACIRHAEDLLERTARHSGLQFYAKNGVLRPALTEKLAVDFRRSPEKYQWPEPGWIKWTEESDFRDKYPWFGAHHGGLEIPHAFTVEADSFIAHLTSYLHSRGLQSYFDTEYTLENSDRSHFKVTLRNGRSFATGSVIDAIGSAIQYSPEWKFLPANSIKGQLIDLTFSKPLPVKNSISSMGYFAINPETPNRLVAGSTYEHHYDDLETDDEGKEYLYDKLERTVPGFKDQEHNVSMWAGERVSMQDHNPVIGRHPELKNRYIIGGLGSKGMIYSRYLAEQLSDLILHGKPIHPFFNLDRFLDS